MLQEIHIRDLGVIDDAVVPLHPRLTVLTGETGAGKTMVVSGLGLLLGARGDTALVREGAERAVVEGIVELPASHPAAVRAADAGADVEDGLVLVRTLTAAGRSRAHVGGRSAPVGVLAELAEHLVAVHGQADQWRLRSGEEHRDLLDSYGGEPLLRLRERHESLHDERSTASRALADLRDRAQERARELEILELGLTQVGDAAPAPGEDEQLRAESMRLTHATDLRAAAEEAAALLSGSEEAYAGDVASVADLLGRVRAVLAQAADRDPALGDLATRATELGHLVAELGSDLVSYATGVEVDPARAEWVEDRRAVLGALTRKYGPTIEDVLAWSEGAARRVAELSGAEDRVDALAERLARLDAELAEVREQLSAARRAAAGELGARVTEELAHLAMGSACVEMAVEPRPAPARHGADDVEIRLAAGPGATARPVTRAASGGELSRVMLAIEVVTADRAGLVPTYVFDEVDAGIGGAAALDVGSRLARLARHAQVVVVTHLAQVAAYADRHLVVTKADDGHVTASGVVEVTGRDRERELARMMAGVQSDTARRHARELVAQVASRED